MKLKDIKDVERYLKEDCYCPGEIYSPDGFFYQVFNSETECVKLCERLDDEYAFIAVVAKSNEKSNPQILVFFKDHDDYDKIVDAERYDATENNIKLVKSISNHENVDNMRFNEFNEGETTKALSEILSISDAIMIN